jgi:chloramphenicol-sensitive protein RarD
MLSQQGKGAVNAVGAYLIWGFFPFFWRLLAPLDSLHVLSVRIIFSCVLVTVILLAKRNTLWLRCFIDKKIRRTVIAAAVTITVNWGIYIWAVNHNQTVEASMGYFINPLVSIILGMIFFHETLRPLQWAAFILASLGVVLITIFSGKLPLISLSLALTFGVYGLLKKSLAVGALEGLAAETCAAFPIAVALLFVPAQGTAYLFHLPAYLYGIFIFAGVVTSIPLFLFAKGARALPLSALGFIQFISPTLQFCIGFLVFREPVAGRLLAAFACIWAGAILGGIPPHR